jgi:hypothetical protein
VKLGREDAAKRKKPLGIFPVPGSTKMKNNNACFECFGFHEGELVLISSFWKQLLPTSLVL